MKTRKSSGYRHLLATLALTSLMLPLPAVAANISDSEKYCWSETSGWANFNPDYGGVTVSGSHLSGYAWLESLGWLKLGSDNGGPYGNTSATDWGVNHDGLGTLSGYAWSENVGWINFNTRYSQVTVDMITGNLSGYAWGEAIGYLQFNNVAEPAFKVQVDMEYDSDGDSLADIDDDCPFDPDKFGPGICGCGGSDLDVDGDTDGQDLAMFLTTFSGELMQLSEFATSYGKIHYLLIH